VLNFCSDFFDILRKKFLVVGAYAFMSQIKFPHIDEIFSSSTLQKDIRGRQKKHIDEIFSPFMAKHTLLY
jgi:hypothetical protein